MTRAHSPVFVDRVAPLQALNAAWQRAVHGRPALVLVGGEAGVGKSRLVSEFVTRAGARAVRGECLALSGGPVPLFAARQLLESLEQPELAELVGSSGGQSLLHLFDQVAAAVVQAQPVVAVVEDLHWADPVTLDLLVFLAHRLVEAQVLVVATFRSEAHELAPWLGEAERLPAVERIDLEPLGDEDAGTLAGEILGRASDPRVRDVVARAQGNPFFIEELAAVPGGGVPSSLRDVLTSRLARLGAEDRAVLRLAAIGGDYIDAALLESVADEPVGGRLRSLVAHDVLALDGRLRFRHALVREAAYDELLPDERLMLHRRFAEALEGVGGVAAAVQRAHHWYAAGVPERALPAAIEAAHAAAGVHAIADAYALMERAVEMWPSVGAAEVAGMDEAAVLERTAELAGQRALHARKVELYDRAFAALDVAREPIRAGLILSRRAQSSWDAGEGGAATLAAHERALELVPEEPPTAARARVLVDYAMSFDARARRTDALPMARRALQAARAAGSLREEAAARTLLGRGGDLGELERAIAIAAQHGFAEEYGVAAGTLACIRLWEGRPEDAMALVVDGMRVIRRLGVEDLWGPLLAQNLAEALLALGRWDEADRQLRQYLHAPRLAPIDACLLRMTAAELALARGDADAAAVELEAAQRCMFPAGCFAEWRLYREWLQARLQLAEGHLEAAWATARSAATDSTADEPYWSRQMLLAVASEIAADLAEEARACGDGDALARVLRELDDLPVRAARPRELFDSTYLDAYAALCAAHRSRALARPAPAAWEEVTARFQALQMPFEVAESRRRLAEALLATGASRAVVAEPLRAAAQMARELGAARLLRAVETLARRACITIDDEPRAGDDRPFDLTTREREVLDLLAQGRTNPQIARELFISPKTAGAHVTSILRKLDAHTRGQAVARGRRAGIIRESAGSTL